MKTQKSENKKERSMNDKLRIGIIGVGQIGQVHLENYRAIPEVEVVAIADTDRVHAQSVAMHLEREVTAGEVVQTSESTAISI
jgi:predicted dehydrogenase